MWIDNFSKIIPRHLPRTNLEFFKSALWTVLGLIPLSGGTDLSLVYDLEAMPKEFLSQAALSSLQTFYSTLEGSSLFRYTTSVSKNITRVPIELQTPLSERAGQRSVFLPFDILPHNIGANYVFIDLVEKLRHDLLEQQPNSYRMILSDINIHNRYLKVRLILIYVLVCV